MKTAPTARTYPGLDAAFDHFNQELFGGELKPCLITLNRHRGAYGYFHAERFANLADAKEITDEIALNPASFARRDSASILSTLVHEMVHLWQHHNGKPSRGNYHNREWADKMDQVGLTPSNTGEPGGKRTGQKMSHVIAKGGPFAKACAFVVSTKGPVIFGDTNRDEITKTKKAASKTKFTCPECEQNAWAKSDARLICGDCEIEMESNP
jgi:hypothetical protein